MWNLWEFAELLKWAELAGLAETGCIALQLADWLELAEFAETNLNMGRNWAERGLEVGCDWVGTGLR